MCSFYRGFRSWRDQKSVHCSELGGVHYIEAQLQQKMIGGTEICVQIGGFHFIEVFTYRGFTVFSGQKFAVISGAVIRTVWSREYGAQTAVNHENSVPFTVPYYCARYYGQIRPIYCRKYTVLTSFTVDKQTVNESVLMNLGRGVNLHFILFKFNFVKS